MSLPVALIAHAVELVSLEQPELKSAEKRSIYDRRAVSAAYYALFHHINGKAVQLIAPNVLPDANHRIQRWFDHLEMKKVCNRFLKPELE